MAKKAVFAQPDAAPVAAAAAAAAATATAPLPDTISIKIEDLLFVRDKFAGGLLNLESACRELRLAYINHFNTLLPEGHPNRIDPFSAFSGTANFGDGSLGALNVGVLGAGTAGAPGSNTKRKRKPHDPNAPKRALTSYFLFMQNNKPSIKELNPGWTAQQVSEESEKRWAHISDGEKKRYEYMYNVDLARYYKQKEEYDAGRPIPDISPDQAQDLYDEHLRTGQLIKGRKGRKVIETAVAAGETVPASAVALAQNADSDEEEVEDKPEPVEEDAEAEADEDDEDDGDDDDESEEEEAPPPKSKKAKTGKAAKAAPKPAASPEKKKARGKKGAAAAAAADESDSLVEEPSDKAKKEKKPAARKRKSGKSE